MDAPLRIGLSACFLHPDPERKLFRNMTLLYMEKAMVDWLLAAGVLPWLIPPASAGFHPRELLGLVDGLLVQAGSDVAPPSYGQQPLKPEWEGDAVRDAYEIELILESLERRLPVFGVCRGHQVLNVALGGSLVQDIPRQLPDAIVHRDPDVYERHGHQVRLLEGGRLRELYGVESGWVNSVHHQAIDALAPGLVVEARCEPDGLIEAVRLRADSFACGVQWHPEFQRSSGTGGLSFAPLLDDFLAAAREYREAR